MSPSFCERCFPHAKWDSRLLSFKINSFELSVSIRVLFELNRNKHSQYKVLHLQYVDCNLTCWMNDPVCGFFLYYVHYLFLPTASSLAFICCAPSTHHSCINDLFGCASSWSQHCFVWIQFQLMEMELSDVSRNAQSHRA